jgi:DNA modification methylase
MSCEKNSRKCFMMEYDPHYVDVIIARWEKFTGKKAELING